MIFSKKSLLWAASPSSKIAIAYNPKASSVTGGSADGTLAWTFSVDQTIINNMVDQAIIALTGMSSVGLAWESIIKAKVPALSTTTKIGIKINAAYFGTYYTYDKRCPYMNRGELIAAVVNGLKQMLGGTYNIENVTVFERKVYDGFEKYMPANGFPASANGSNSYDVGGSGTGQQRTVLVNSSDTSSSSFSIGPIQGTTCTQSILNIVTQQAVLIDIAVPKVNRGAGVTGCMKNCFGMVGDCSKTHPKNGGLGDIIHDCVPAYYKAINAVVPIALNILDGIGGNYAKDAYEGPAFIANKIALSTDPVTLDFLAVELVNTARTANGWAAVQTPAVTTDRYTMQGAMYPGTVNSSPTKTFYDDINNSFSTYVNCHSLAVAAQSGLGTLNAGNRIIIDTSGVIMPSELASLDVPHGRVLGAHRNGNSWRLNIQLDGSGRTHSATSRIVDLTGRELRSFPSQKTSFASMSFDWDGKNSFGQSAAKGVYCWETTVDGVASSQTIHFQ